MKNKLPFTICLLIIFTAIILVGGIAFAKGFEEIKDCQDGEIALDSKFPPITKQPMERKCLSTIDYAKLKYDLKQSRADNLKIKGYDFDINDREDLEAIFSYEINKRGGLTIQGATKEKIKSELLKLLD